ncbi:hypothetical protein [Nitrospirillum viridazoti]|uniref:Uncharacterized protein n=1 Tax=Nitrospirillum viridazoti CBAmc TaxID=1441467 RepID=A0A248JSB6_9PROT|nr:hypothetical protein [Nitrospirillum amazonense]ASG21623.1 hypothetical protein Y958_13035 [Nitrospirillum amazonense CBAmc]TWB42223.1 hypothetical protein FBZ91_103239 [Nitrospirillum amazonense]
MPTRPAYLPTVTAALLTSVLLTGALLAAPAGAQQTTTAQPTATTQTVTVPAPGPRRGAETATRQEDIIITPRAYPSYEEDDAFHRAEYDRLNAIYGKPVPISTRADTLMDVPLGKLPQDRSALRAIIADPDTPHLSDVVAPESK